MGWDPTAKIEPVTFDVEASRGPDGIAAATVTLRRWATRERLAYEDGTLDAMRIDYGTGPDGDQVRIKRVIPSRLYLLHMRLTLVSCTGFPDMTDAAGNTVPFDVRNVEHLKAIDEETFSELVKLCERVQPLPTGEVKRPQDHKAKHAEPGDDGSLEGDAPGEGDEDPSRTPSTPT